MLNEMNQIVITNAGDDWDLDELAEILGSIRNKK